LYQDVLETADQIGNSLERLNALNGLGYTSKMQGDLGSAEKYYRSALETASEMGPMKIYPIELDLADVLLSRARISDAQALIARALPIARGAGEKDGIAAGLALWAHTLALKGNVSEAQTKYNESTAILREVKEPYQLCLVLLALGDTFIQQGNIAAARAKFEEAQSEAQRFPGGFADSEIRMAFARMNLEGGHFDQAETNARAALDLFTRSGREGDRIIAAAVLARALAGEGKIQQAAEAITQSPALNAKDLPVWVPLELQIARGDCLAHSGKSAEAARMMDSVASEMLRLGLPGLEKEAMTAKKAFLKFRLDNSTR
jgi:tetratricopeptide (TPR) repeat protein